MAIEIVPVLSSPQMLFPPVMSGPYKMFLPVMPTEVFPASWVMAIDGCSCQSCYGHIKCSCLSCYASKVVPASWVMAMKIVPVCLVKPTEVGLASQVDN